MDGETGTLTPYMQRVKTQTEVLVPLLQHLRTELGEIRVKATSIVDVGSIGLFCPRNRAEAL
jgi:hypothetical protein